MTDRINPCRVTGCTAWVSERSITGLCKEHVHEPGYCECLQCTKVAKRNGPRVGPPVAGNITPEIVGQFYAAFRNKPCTISDLCNRMGTTDRNLVKRLCRVGVDCGSIRREDMSHGSIFERVAR